METAQKEYGDLHRSTGRSTARLELLQAQATWLGAAAMRKEPPVCHFRRNSHGDLIGPSPEYTYMKRCVNMELRALEVSEPRRTYEGRESVRRHRKCLVETQKFMRDHG